MGVTDQCQFSSLKPRYNFCISRTNQSDEGYDQCQCVENGIMGRHE